MEGAAVKRRRTDGGDKDHGQVNACPFISHTRAFPLNGKAGHLTAVVYDESLIQNIGKAADGKGPSEHWREDGNHAVGPSHGVHSLDDDSGADLRDDREPSGASLGTERRNMQTRSSSAGAMAANGMHDADDVLHHADRDLQDGAGNALESDELSAAGNHIHADGAVISLAIGQGENGHAEQSGGGSVGLQGADHNGMVKAEAGSWLHAVRTAGLSIDEELQWEGEGRGGLRLGTSEPAERITPGVNEGEGAWALHNPARDPNCSHLAYQGTGSIGSWQHNLGTGDRLNGSCETDAVLLKQTSVSAATNAANNIAGMFHGPVKQAVAGPRVHAARANVREVDLVKVPSATAEVVSWGGVPAVLGATSQQWPLQPQSQTFGPHTSYGNFREAAQGSEPQAQANQTLGQMPKSSQHLPPGTYPSLPPPAAFLGPKCALWDCLRPAQGDYCSDLHSAMAASEGGSGRAPVVRPWGIELKDPLLLAALRARIAGKAVGIPDCERAATAKSPWGAPDLFDVNMLVGEPLREWLFFDKSQPAYGTGTRKQRALPDYSGRWHDSYKQQFKDHGGLKRILYLDPQPPGIVEWHLYEYEIKGALDWALYRLEMKKKDPTKMVNNALVHASQKGGHKSAFTVVKPRPL